MTKSKYSTTSIVFLSIFVIYLVNGVQFLNDTCVAVTVILPYTISIIIVIKKIRF